MQSLLGPGPDGLRTLPCCSRRETLQSTLSSCRASAREPSEVCARLALALPLFLLRLDAHRSMRSQCFPGFCTRLGPNYTCLYRTPRYPRNSLRLQSRLPSRECGHQSGKEAGSTSAQSSPPYEAAAKARLSVQDSHFSAAAPLLR